MKLVAIQGIRGSYSEEAALRMLGTSALIECESFARVFGAVISKQAGCAVVPLRNKIVGEIETVSELLEQSELDILDEFDLEIHHVLAGTSGATIGELSSVRSHEQALKQCSNFMAAHSQLQPVRGSDTASSIRQVATEGVRQNAAIGSRRAAEIYGATVLCEDIADDADNWTTFGLIGRKGLVIAR